MSFIFVKSFLVFIHIVITAIYDTRVHKDQIILWRKMHLKCFCLWIYRDGIWIKPRQCRDNCRGDQILHRQDNRLLSIVRRTKMMTSYRQIPVPSNKSFIKHPKNLCLFTTKQAGRTLIHRDIRSRTASNDPFPLRWVHWIAAESILVLNDSSVD